MSAYSSTRKLNVGGSGARSPKFDARSFGTTRSPVTTEEKFKELAGGGSMKNIRTLLGIILLLISLPAFAQGGGQAAISGTVVDPTGAAISGAKVTVTQKGTSAHRVVVADANGAFNVPSLLPATYTVAVQAPGFKTYSADLTILADQLRSL